MPLVLGCSALWRGWVKARASPDTRRDWTNWTPHFQVLGCRGRRPQLAAHLRTKPVAATRGRLEWPQRRVTTSTPPHPPPLHPTSPPSRAVRFLLWPRPSGKAADRVRAKPQAGQGRGRDALPCPLHPQRWPVRTGNRYLLRVCAGQRLRSGSYSPLGGGGREDAGSRQRAASELGWGVV